MSTLERAQTKLRSAATDVSRLAAKRDKALDALIRAETRYRKAIKTVGRTQKRYDKLREEARAIREAKDARRKAEKAAAAKPMAQSSVIGGRIDANLADLLSS